MRTILGATALTFILATGAQTQEILSAGALFAGPTQFRAVCYIYGAGPGNLALGPVRITDNAGTSLPLVVNECGVTLRGSTSCGIAANIANNRPYNCTVTVSPNKRSARGVLELRNSSGTSLTNVELR